MTRTVNFHARLSRLDELLWRLILRMCLKQLTSRRDAPPGLTQRQGEIWELYSRGMSTAEIAQCLTIEASTVRSHVKNVRSKLGLAGVSREQLKADDKDQGKGEQDV